MANKYSMVIIICVPRIRCNYDKLENVIINSFEIIKKYI